MSLGLMTEVRNRTPKGIPPAARNLLLWLAEGAGEHRMVWMSIATLMDICDLSRAGVYASLKRLRELSIIEDVPESEWPAEAFHYKSVVRRILPPEHWQGPGAVVTPFPSPRSSDDGYSRGVQDLDPHLQVVTKRALGGPGSGPKPKAFNNQHENPSDFRMEQATDQSPRSLSRAAQTRATAEAERDLDPAIVLGLGQQQEKEPPSRKARSISPDSAMGLALEFKKAIPSSTSPGTTWAPSPTNTAALAKNFSNWLREGVTASEIRLMISFYASVPAYRNTKAVAWKDFLHGRALLLDLARTQLQAAQPRDSEYWTADTSRPIRSKDYWT